MGDGFHAFIGTVSGLIFCYFLVKEGLFSEEMPASFAYIAFGLFFGGLGWAWNDIDEQQPLEIMKNKTKLLPAEHHYFPLITKVNKITKIIARSGY